MKLKEVWKNIQNYPNYQVSNFGNIKSKKRYVKQKNGMSLKKERILKPNMYVRYKYHNEQKIGKVDFIIYNKFGDENFIGLTNNESIFEGKILKASFNIIDLIEVGDYVNGEKVTKLIDRKIYHENLNDPYYDIYFENKDIKSIVTKEQFNRCKYVVERNK